MTLSREQARELLAELNMGLEDPMTCAMGASEFVYESWYAKLRKLGVTRDDVLEAAGEDQD